MKYKHFVFLLFFLLTSCVTEVEFEAKDTEPQLVVNAIAEVGQPLNVSLTYSTPIFSNKTNEYGYTIIKDAEVTLTINGNSEQLSYNSFSRQYESTHIIQYSDSLNLTVITRQKTASASIRVIDEAVTIDKTDFITDNRLGVFDYTEEHIVNYWYMYATLCITFSDPSDKNNYYLADYYGNLYTTGTNDTIKTTVEWFNFEQGLSENSSELDLSDNFSSTDNRVFADDIYNGKTIRITKDAYFFVYRTYSDEKDSQMTVDSLIIDYSLYNIDRQLYLYLQTANSNQLSSGFFSLFAEPVQVYTNIEGGMGIFASMARTTKRERIF